MQKDILIEQDGLQCRNSPAQQTSAMWSSAMSSSAPLSSLEAVKQCIEESSSNFPQSAGLDSPIWYLSWLIWWGMLSLPLAMGVWESSPLHYTKVFDRSMWGPELWQGTGYWPSPLGLSLGLLAVVVGQIWVLCYHALRWRGLFGPNRPIQKKGAPEYKFMEDMMVHLAQPEGFAMLGFYLCGTWMCQIMPASYYIFEGGINWRQVALQLLLQEGTQYSMHMMEHMLSPALYKASHKAHHRFTNPKLFDAFNGSTADTFLMILVPLFVTSHVVHCNVWTYMAFGSLYANWLTLIHCEWAHPWDLLFRKIGFGTAADHHVHHKLFVYNYGHLFMYYDWICGTYRDPKDVDVFNTRV